MVRWAPNLSLLCACACRVNPRRYNNSVPPDDIASMTPSQRWQHVRGFSLGVFSFAVLMEGFVATRSAGRPLYMTLVDVLATQTVAALYQHSDGNGTLLPLNTSLTNVRYPICIANAVPVPGARRFVFAASGSHRATWSTTVSCLDVAGDASAGRGT